MQLPPELVIAFISHHDKREGWFPTLYSVEEALAKTTLLACSEASYSLRQATLPSLFHTLAVSVRVERDTENDTPAPGCTCRRLSKLVALGDIQPVCDNVRELRIRALCSACRTHVPPITVAGLSWSGVLYRLIDGNLLLRALSNFNHLRVLNMQECPPSWGTPKPWSTNLKTPPVLSLDSFSFSLRGLAIDVCIFEPFLKCCTRVGRIYFSGFKFCFTELWGLGEDPPGPVYEKFSRPVAITSIATKGCMEVGDLLDFLSARAAIPADSLDSLELSFAAGPSEDVESISYFLRLFAQNATRITLRPMDFYRWPPRWDFRRLGIAECARLSHFALQFEFKAAMSAAIVPLVLHSLPGLPSLRSITFIIDTELLPPHTLMTHLGEPFMKPIEDAILELGRIEQVAIELPDMRWGDDAALIAEWKRAVLPQLHRDRVLV